MNAAIIFWSLALTQVAIFLSFLIASKKESSDTGPENKIQDLNSLLTSLQSEMDATRAEYAASHVELQNQKQDNSDLNNELLKQKALLEAVNKQIERLKTEKGQLQEKLADDEKQLQEILPNKSNLQKQIEEKDLELMQTKKDNTEMAVTMESLKSQIKILTNEKVNLSEELLKQRNSYSSLVKESRLIDNAQQQANIKSAELNKEMVGESSQGQNLEIKINGYENRIRSLEEENKDTLNKANDMQIQFEILEKERNTLANELLKQKKSYSILIAECDRLKKEKLELKEELENKEKQADPENKNTEKELKERNKEILLLKESNKLTANSLRDLEFQLKKALVDKESQDIVSPPNKIEKTTSKSLKENDIKKRMAAELSREKNKQKVGEILLENKLITREALDKAKEYQNKFGGNITQYLLGYGYIEENQLARCLCTQFGLPYLPLSSYRIPSEIIKLVPVNIAEKYWLIPVDKLNDVLTVVMVDPFNTKAIKEVEEITGCDVQPFLGLLSEIMDALKNYYKVIIKDVEPKSRFTLPFFIDTETYKGPERRDSIRFPSKIEVSYAEQNLYKNSQTKDVSRNGFSFTSNGALPIGSLLTLQVNLPKEWSPLPIACVVQVTRVKPLANEEFETGVKIIKISLDELNIILRYASSHKEKTEEKEENRDTV